MEPYNNKKDLQNCARNKNDEKGICDRRDIKLKEAEKTIANKDVIIKMLQDHVKKLEESYKENLKETESFRYKFCLAAEQIRRLRSASSGPTTDCRCEFAAWKQPCTPLPEVEAYCPTAFAGCNHLQQIKNIENFMKTHHDLLQTLLNKIPEKSTDDQSNRNDTNVSKEKNDEIMKLQAELKRLQDENDKLKSQGKELGPKDSVIETYRRTNQELNRQVSCLLEKIGSKEVLSESSENTIEVEVSAARKISFCDSHLILSASSASDEENESDEAHVPQSDAKHRNKSIDKKCQKMPKTDGGSLTSEEEIMKKEESSNFKDAKVQITEIIIENQDSREKNGKMNTSQKNKNLQMVLTLVEEIASDVEDKTSCVCSKNVKSTEKDKVPAMKYGADSVCSNSLNSLEENETPEKDKTSCVCANTVNPSEKDRLPEKTDETGDVCLNNINSPEKDKAPDKDGTDRVCLNSVNSPEKDKVLKEDGSDCVYLNSVNPSEENKVPKKKVEIDDCLNGVNSSEENKGSEADKIDCVCLKRADVSKRVEISEKKDKADCICLNSVSSPEEKVPETKGEIDGCLNGVKSSEENKESEADKIDCVCLKCDKADCICLNSVSSPEENKGTEGDKIGCICSKSVKRVEISEKKDEADCICSNSVSSSEKAKVPEKRETDGICLNSVNPSEEDKVPEKKDERDDVYLNSANPCEQDKVLGDKTGCVCLNNVNPPEKGNAPQQDKLQRVPSNGEDAEAHVMFQTLDKDNNEEEDNKKVSNFDNDTLNNILLKLKDIDDRVKELLHSRTDTSDEINVLKNEIITSRIFMQECIASITKLTEKIDKQSETFATQFDQQLTTMGDLKDINKTIQCGLGRLGAKVEEIRQDFEDLNKDYKRVPLKNGPPSDVITVDECYHEIYKLHGDPAPFRTVTTKSCGPETQIDENHADCTPSVTEEEVMVPRPDSAAPCSAQKLEQKHRDLKGGDDKKEQKIKCVNALLSYWIEARKNCLGVCPRSSADIQKYIDEHLKECKCGDDEIHNYIEKIRGENLKLKTTISNVILHLNKKLDELKGIEHQTNSASCLGAKNTEAVATEWDKLKGIEDQNKSAKCLCEENAESFLAETDYEHKCHSHTVCDYASHVHSEMEIEDIYNAVRRTVMPQCSRFNSSSSCLCSRLNKRSSLSWSCQGSCQNEEDTYSSLFYVCDGSKPYEFVPLCDQTCAHQNPCQISQEPLANTVCGGEHDCVADKCNSGQLISSLETYVNYLHEQLDIITHVEDQIEDLRLRIKTP